MSEENKQGYLNINSSLYLTRLSRKFEQRKKYTPANPGNILSYIPGTVLEILVSAGDEVKKGDGLVIIDAMKMQNKLASTSDGKVRAVRVKKGDKVNKGTLVVELDIDQQATGIEEIE